MPEIAKAPEVTDLDILKPPPVIVRILGVDLNVGFVPFGVTMEVERLQQQLTALEDGRDRGELIADPEYGRQAIKLQTEIALLIAQYQAPEITRERLEGECTLEQIDGLLRMTFRHMYGPRSAQVFDKAMADVAAGKDNGASKSAKKGGSNTSGPTRSRNSESSTDGRPTTSAAG